jgi:hypothetical protein
MHICLCQPINGIVFMDKLLHLNLSTNLCNDANTTWLHGCLVTYQALQLHALPSKFTACLNVDTVTLAVTPPIIWVS